MPFLMSPKKKNLITKLKINLITKKKKSKNNKLFKITKKPVKGGFYAESSGIKGFISKTEFDFTKKPKNLKKDLKNETKLNKKTNISSNSKKQN